MMRGNGANYMPSRSSCCNAPVWRRNRNHDWRCTLCGHRFILPGQRNGGVRMQPDYVPTQTRELPPWFWPIELIDRYRARHIERRSPWRVRGRA